MPEDLHGPRVTIPHVWLHFYAGACVPLTRMPLWEHLPRHNVASGATAEAHSALRATGAMLRCSQPLSPLDGHTDLGYCGRRSATGCAPGPRRSRSTPVCRCCPLTIASP